MCLSVPVKILEIKNNKAVVEINGNKQGVGIDLIPEIRENDYCLVSNGFVVKKISAKEAEEIFKILKPVKNEAKASRFFRRGAVGVGHGLLAAHQIDDLESAHGQSDGAADPEALFVRAPGGQAVVHPLEGGDVHGPGPGDFADDAAHGV